MPPQAILDVAGIQRILPHRYPFLLIDRVVELTAEHCVAIKNVTINEPFFAGTFPRPPGDAGGADPGGDGAGLRGARALAGGKDRRTR